MICIGHRGASGYEPENTLRSFEKAIELGVDIIEFDVRKCASGELVVFHDSFLSRVVGIQEKIFQKNLEFLKTLDVGGGEKIPTFQEALECINGRVMVNVHMNDDKIASEVIDVIEKLVKNGKWKIEDFLISSFFYSELFVVKKRMPNIKVGVFMKVIPRAIFFGKKIKAYSIHVRYPFIYKVLVKWIHKNNMKVFVWTINEQKTIERMKRLGVDGIFTDYPDRV